ncbi:MAG: hypothetical protein NT129_05640 [Candidatus Aenigmarchaeota archaeon]|nr:hypothetical protein [Candidatus Aenigmarchaeota archaeon]
MKKIKLYPILLILVITVAFSGCVSEEDNKIVKNICNKDNVQSVLKCEGGYMLVHGCCDMGDEFYKSNGTYIRSCGGFVGYTEECTNFYNSFKPCNEGNLCR